MAILPICRYTDIGDCRYADIADADINIGTPLLFWTPGGSLEICRHSKNGMSTVEKS